MHVINDGCKGKKTACNSSMLNTEQRDRGMGLDFTLLLLFFFFLTFSLFACKISENTNKQFNFSYGKVTPNESFTYIKSFTCIKYKDK